MKKIIRFTKQNGEIPCREAVFSRLENVFKTIPNGEYTLYPEKEVKHRSVSSNRLMWLWFTCIEYETGQGKDDVHDYFCSKFLKKTIEFNGKTEAVVRGTSVLNTIEFTNFLEKVQSETASELGIQLPNPNDARWSEFEDFYRNYL